MMLKMKTEKDEIDKQKKKKKQRNNNGCGYGGSNNDCELGFEFAEDEIEVANTLLNLPFLISKTVSSCRFSYYWGSKRRRSALDNPPPPPPPPQRKEVVALLPPPAADVTAVTAVTSPDTPLGFPTSESDEKSNRSLKRKTPVKRTGEELQQMEDERIQTQLTLIEEIEKVKLHREKLKAENYELKSQKQKLMERVNVRREKNQLEDFDGLKPATEYPDQQRTAVNDSVHASPSTPTQFHQQPPLIPHRQGFIINQTDHIEPGFRRQLHYQQLHQLGPLGFDLNVSAAEMVAMESALQPLDQWFVRNMMIKLNSAIEVARAARQNRIRINRSKKPSRVR